MVNVINNGYGMGGQTNGETMGYKEVARLGAGFNPEGLHAERVNGMNVLAMIDMMNRKKPIAEKGDGPILNEMVAYRFSGHSSADAEPYRDEAEVNE